MGNMELWTKLEKTDPKYTKQAKLKGGFNITAVNATYQAKQMTSMFGSYGIGWGLQNTSYQIQELSNDFHDNILVYTGELYYVIEDKKGVIPIDAEIDLWVYSQKYKSWSKNNDVYKKVKTDAMTKGFSMIGLSADVFLGLYDDNKYINEVRHEFEGNNPNYQEKIQEKFDGQEINARQEIFNLLESGKVPAKDKENYIARFKANPSLVNQKTVVEIKAKYFG